MKKIPIIKHSDLLAQSKNLASSAASPPSSETIEQNSPKSSSENDDCLSCETKILNNSDCAKSTGWNAQRYILDHLPSTIVLLDENLRVIDCNAHFVRLSQMPYEHLLGKSFLQIIHQPDVFQNIDFSKIKKNLSFGSTKHSAQVQNLNLTNCVPTTNQTNPPNVIWSSELVEHFNHTSINVQAHLIPVFAACNTHIGYLYTSQNVLSFKQEQQRLYQLSIHDPLTNALNRSAFDEHLKILFDPNTRTITNKCPSLLVYVDVDHFKSFNDLQGHICGDAILKTVCDQITSQLEPNDRLFRIGGDEFVLLLCTTPTPECACLGAFRHCYHKVQQRLEKILDSFSTPILLESFGSFTIGLSMGASWFENSLQSPQEWMKRSDSALYFAKKQGRNQIQYWNFELNNNSEQLSAHLEALNEKRSAPA